MRVHWQIEALHWIRDVSFGEDLSQVRAGNCAVMATPRNFTVSRRRLAATTSASTCLRGPQQLLRHAHGARRSSGRGSLCRHHGPNRRGLTVNKQPPGNGVMVKLFSS
jgi:hypothetical protein